MMLLRTLVLLLLFIASVAGQRLRKIAAIDLPGPKGQRFDYLAMDVEDHWLLSAHLGPGLLYAIDIQTNRVLKILLGFQASPASNTFRACERFTHPTGVKRRSALLISLHSA
jgi:hypothetical protein